MDDKIYKSVKQLVDATAPTPKIVIPNMSLTREESRKLSRNISKKIMKHSDVPEYHADILADHIVEDIQVILKLKTQEAKQKAYNPTQTSGGPFRRVE